MKIYKFGGVSIKDAAAIKNVGDIIESVHDDTVMLVVSAVGKTTNALESVLNAFYHQEGNALLELKEIEAAHIALAKGLLAEPDGTIRKIDNYCEVTRLFLRDAPAENFDYLYDQIVSLGEILSTTIVSDYLNSRNIVNDWIDARSIIRTNNTYREARIDWEATTDRIRKRIKPILDSRHVVTQGFIGGTTENLTTTLGREGSDFTASIFGYGLDATEVTIWKDVPGVLNADPTLFNNAAKIDFLSYRDAIEMTYYGAKVIHPKTIKPLQNKGIPLRVRSFIDKGNSGTLIKDDLDFSFIPPVIVIKPNQILVNVSSRDFSFIAEDNLSVIFSLFARHRVKLNMMKNTAISFTVCFDNDKRKTSGLLEELNRQFDIECTEQLKLLTIHHFNDTVKAELTGGHEILLEEKFKNTLQVLMREI